MLKEKPSSESENSRSERISDAVLSFKSALSSDATPEDLREESRLREQLIATLEPLRPYSEKYSDYYSYITPAGADGRTLDEEHNDFLDRRKDDPQAVPTYTYPNLMDLDYLDDEEDLEKMISDIKTDDKLDKNVKSLAVKAIEAVKIKLELFRSIQSGNDQKTMTIQKRMFGELMPEAILVAREAYLNRIDIDRKKPADNIVSKLKENEFNASEIQEYFNTALRELGINDVFGTEISNIVKSITMKIFPEDGGSPRVFIPESRVVDGLYLLKLIAHEIGTHAVTGANALALNLPVELGPEYETVQEGVAKLSELQIESDIRRLNPDEFDNGPLPYNVMALDIVNQGGNFRDVFEAMLRARSFIWLSLNCREAPEVKDLLIKAKDAIAHPLPNLDLTSKEKELMALAEKRVIKSALTQCYRIFRGFHNLSVGGQAFYKDKAYLEGAIIAKQFQTDGLESVLIKGRIDPFYAQELIAIGIHNTRARTVVRDIAQKILLKSKDDLLAERWLRESKIWYSKTGNNLDISPKTPDVEDVNDMFREISGVD